MIWYCDIFKIKPILQINPLWFLAQYLLYNDYYNTILKQIINSVLQSFSNSERGYYFNKYNFRILLTYNTMKRGKRQIVQKPIVFDGQDQSSHNQQLLSHFSNPNDQINKPTQSTTKQHIVNQQQKDITHQRRQKKEIQILKQPIIQKPSIMKAQENNTASHDDEKKKRLQALRQKYLKKGQANILQTNKSQISELNEKQTQKQKPISFKELEKVDKKQQNPQQYVTKIQETNNFFDSFAQSSSSSTQGNHPVSPNYFLQNQLPNESITSHNQNKVSIPPVPETKRNKRQPTKPVISIKSTIDPVTPQFNTSFEEENNCEQKRKQIKSSIQNQFNPYLMEPSKENMKKESVLMTKASLPQKKTLNSQNRQNQAGIQSLNQAILNWLTSSSSFKNLNRSLQSQNKIFQLVKQISKNEDEHTHNIAYKFMILNSVQYTSQQSIFVRDELINSSHISELSRLYFSIKCGLEALNNIAPEISSETLQQLMDLKSFLLENQQQNLITYYLQRVDGQNKQQILSKLFEFCPNSAIIHSYISSYHFQNPRNIASLLTLIKKYISSNEGLCTVYFKLINLLIIHISDQALLQDILKLVNNINYGSVYQMKKDTKLKIIQKLDKTNKPNASSYAQIGRQQPKISYENNKLQKDKGLGVSNFFGRAIKIISQIPQKISTPPPIEQQPKDTIVWDPVLGRHLINGKIPQNEEGGVFDSTNEEKETKKKAPPPPPRPSKAKKSSKIEANKQKDEIKNSFQQQNSAQQTKQVYYQGQNNQNTFAKEQDKEQASNGIQVPSAPAGPPGRVGIKGLAKKPKVTARYA